MAMLISPNIDPVLLSMGPLQIRWYGMMYVLGFIASYLLVRHQIRRFALVAAAEQFENLNFVLIVSLVMGGRLGYVLFYNFSWYLHHPLEILATWHGGMSFHGALIGMLAGGFLFCRQKGLNFLETADLYIVTTPIGIGLGRVGNFINGELYGRVSDVPWAMLFAEAGPGPRHPSQLYEAATEGALLFCILWRLKTVKRRKSWPHGSMLAAFLILYGLFRFCIEFFRQPDSHLGFLFGWATRGQLFCAVMICAGLILFFTVKNKAAS